MELLVVIVIIGILSGMGIAQYRSYMNKAKDAKITSDLAQISKILQADRVSRNKSDYSHLIKNEDGQLRNDAVEVVRIIKEAGFKLPSPDEACYFIMIPWELHEKSFPYGKKTDFAVVSLRSGMLNTNLEAPFGEMILANGTSESVNVLLNPALNPRRGSGYTWGKSLRSWYKDYYKGACKDSPSYEYWNGIALNGQPYINAFSFIPIDPSL
ncbi:hypothetical protein CSB37_02255 [bacterium DOLZORAL124_38_8]|nr:MAG: hypothetical protein CSB37_02255 [bacterium DOLZORAL124_38_8]